MVKGAWRTMSGGMFKPVSFDGADLSHASFKRAALEASFSGTNLTSANFNNATVNCRNFDKATMTLTNFEGAKLKDDQDFTNVVMENANLKKVDHSSGLLDFTGSNMTGVNLENANLQAVTITPEQLSQTQSFAGANFNFVTASSRMGDIEESVQLSKKRYKDRIEKCPNISSLIQLAEQAKFDSMLRYEPHLDIRLDTTQHYFNYRPTYKTYDIDFIEPVTKPGESAACQEVIRAIVDEAIARVKSMEVPMDEKTMAALKSLDKLVNRGMLHGLFSSKESDLSNAMKENLKLPPSLPPRKGAQQGEQKPDVKEEPSDSGPRP
jgi:hypothetical protein